MVVQTRTGDADPELRPGETFAVAPKTAHRVAGKDGGRCRFVLVQGVGAYDYIPLEG